MNGLTRFFHSENARFQVKNGFGVLVKASDVAVGRGIYNELFRDHEWLHISRVTPAADGQIEIEYLEKTSAHDKSTEGDVTTEVTEERTVKHTLTLQGADDVLISAELLSRPKGRRITVVTTRVRTEEPLDD